MSEERLSGGCQCGAVRYSIPVPKKGIHLCHCRMCQKAVGNVFAALAPVPRDTVQWTKGAPAIFKSSSVASRGFCRDCGTPLTFEYIDGKNINVTIGSLDHPEHTPPGIHYGVEAWVPWLKLDDGLPQERTDEGAITSRLGKLRNFQHPDHD